jgi:site-specific DNA-methyltransferase (adenine-specific)
MIRISKNQIIFGGNYFIEHLTNSSCWIVWDKDNAESFFADCELAWTSFNTAVIKFKFRWFGMLQEDMKNKEERFHPTQKPVALFKWIIANYSEENNLIFDPFMGSGTTGVACGMLGRKFIGCEISENYYKIAEARIKASYNQTRLF